MANPRGHVYAIEPGKKNFEFLQKNIKTNSFENIVVVNAAIAESSGYQNFHENSAWGYLESQGAKTDLGTTRVLTVDDFVTENKLSRCDLIKIDVEGFEDHVFRGMTETLQKFNPRIIFEYNSFCMLAYGKTNPLEFMEMIGSRFENVYRFTKDKNSSELLQLVSRSNFGVSALHQNVVSDGSVNDYYIYN
jgi:FkbM family methyltransferase